MTVRGSIYGAYGIRGIWGTDIDAALVAKLGRAYVAMQRPKRVAIGRDGRVSGPAFHDALVEAIRGTGVDVIDIGVISVDAFYFAVKHLGVDGGAMITASHNPSEWNGVKFVDGDAQLLVGEQNKELGRIVDSLLSASMGLAQGSYTESDIVSAFVEYIRYAVDGFTNVPRKVVVDPGNGAVARVLPALFSGTSIEWSGINLDIDGAFPGRGPDPKKNGALDGLARAVVARGADVGIAFDADGDRMFMVDEKGRALTGETTGLIVARSLLAREPGASIVYNVVCSHSVPECIKEFGGVPVRSGVGSVNMKPAIARSSALIGIETSGHYIVRALNFIDSGIVPMAFALRALVEDGRPLSEIATSYDRYHHEFIDCKVADVPKIMDAIRTTFRSDILDELDGITVEGKDWWFNVRPSNTEPLLRVTIEAHTKLMLAERRQALMAVVSSSTS